MLLLYMNYINPQDHQSQDWLFLSSCSYCYASYQVGAIKTLLGNVEKFELSQKHCYYRATKSVYI